VAHTHGAEPNFRDGKPGRRTGSGEFVGSRSITLAANLELLVARYETGVLTLRILVAESAKPRKVRITEGADERTIEVQTTRGRARP
jgi:hypothetical protein